MLALEQVVHECVVRSAEVRVQGTQIRNGRGGRFSREDEVLRAGLHEQRTGRDERAQIDVLDRTELVGHDLRAAHVPWHPMGGLPGREVARHDRGLDPLVERGQEQRARPAV